MDKKARTILLIVIFFLILFLTTTYGLWYVTRRQTNRNIIATKCLDISLSNEENDITLTEAYPITDEEGLKLTPYTFTLTNNCNTKIDYQLNLELLGDREFSVNASAIKVSLNDNKTLLSNKETRETTIENAYESYQLMYGRLEANESEDYSLRLWVDEEAPISESNKIFESKVSIVAGQGIENPYNEGTMAFNIVGNAGGTGYVTELSTEWKEGEFSSERDIGISYTDNCFWGTDYEFDVETGFVLSGDVVQATIKECRATEGLCGKYTFLNNEKDAANERLFLVNSLYSETPDWGGGPFIKVQEKTKDNGFSTITNDDYAKLHKAEDDFGTSYYYRGAPTSNYVQFGTWNEELTEVRGYYSTDGTGGYEVHESLESCNADSYANNNCTEVALANKGDDMYWRIVRINGDGTIRMIYDGTEAVANGITHIARIGETAYNTNYDNAKYVGYTYENEEGTQVDSTIKNYIDAWYDTNLKTNYGTYIADSGFCNDRTSRTDDDGTTNYGAYDRLYTDKAPQLKCNQTTDNYTINTEYGNGHLTNPVGLITADEIAMAGGVSTLANNTFYLANGDGWYSTFSPKVFSHRYAYVWSFLYGYSLNSSSVSYPDGGARPVINLKADVKFTGSGTLDDPFRLVS